MKKGYTKSWRKELESEIWIMPPIYHRVWFWIRQKVQHEVYLFPTPKRVGIWVLPGQRICSIQQIAEGVKWAEWGKEYVPNKKTIKTVLDWLESHEMISVESNANGTMISVVNWDTYNGVAGDKSNAEVTLSIHKEECKIIEPIKPITRKKPSRPPSGDHQTFLSYWQYAHKKIRREDAYISGSDQKAIKNMLDQKIKVGRMIVCAAHFLLDPDPWLNDKKTITMLQTRLGGMPRFKEMDTDRMLDERLIPPDGVKIPEWKFWEQDND